MAEITSFRVGHCRHPSCMALKGSGWQARSFPAHAYLITARHGQWLWDTGYAEHFLDASAHGVYRLYPRVTPVDCEVPLHAQLAARGIAPAGIGSVVLSHFHADHIAGVRDFPASRLLCSALAWQAVRGLSGMRALRQGFLPQLLPPDIEDRLAFVETFPVTALPASLLPFRQGWDISGSGEIIVVALPGHAYGQLGAFVQGAGGWTLLASDAAWLSAGYRELRGPSALSFLVQHDRRAYYRTLGMLHQLHLSGQAEIRLAHDDRADPAPAGSSATP